MADTTTEFPLHQGERVAAQPGVDLEPHTVSWSGTIDGRDVTMHWAIYAVVEFRWSLHVRGDDGTHELFQAATADEVVAAMRAALA